MTEQRVHAPVRLRRAFPNEAALLTALALRAKASWGYDAAFLEACRHELTLTPEQLTRELTFVADVTGQVIGFARIIPWHADPTDAELSHLFIEPAYHGQGYGRLLFHHATQVAAASAFRRLWIVSDPHAAAFYHAMGATEIGHVPSGCIPGRFLPLYCFELQRQAPA